MQIPPNRWERISRLAEDQPHGSGAKLLSMCFFSRMFADCVQTLASTVTFDCICLSVTALQSGRLLFDPVGRVDAFFSFLKLCQTLLFWTRLCLKSFEWVYLSSMVKDWRLLAQLNQQSRQTVTWSVDWTEWHWHALLNFILDKFLYIQQHLSVRSKTKLACVPPCCMNMLNISLSHLGGSSETTAND